MEDNWLADEEGELKIFLVVLKQWKSLMSVDMIGVGQNLQYLWANMFIAHLKIIPGRVKIIQKCQQQKKHKTYIVSDLHTCLV